MLLGMVASWRVVRAALLCSALAVLASLGLAASGCSKKPADDYEVRVLADKNDAVPQGFLPLAYDQRAADGTCQRSAGVVVMRRPERTTSVALFTCYRHSDERVIAVTLRLPDEPWQRAGWTRCAADEERAFQEACRAPAQ
jgi:hypothetical protein